MKPRFRAERVVVSEELLILASCLLRPMSRNSVQCAFDRLRLTDCRHCQPVEAYCDTSDSQVPE